jgi:UPF0755 protein
MRKKHKIGAIIIVIFSIVGLIIGYQMYSKRYASNISKTGQLFIPTGATYKQVLDSIQPYLKNKESFEWMAQKERYNTADIKPGRYTLKKGENNITIVRRLSLGLQDDITVRIGNYASVFEFAGRMSSVLEADSTALLQAIIQADFSKGYDTAQLIAFYIPNTYKLHWSTTPQAFVARMKKEYDKYWTPEKVNIAANQKMIPVEVTTLASIVQLEAAKVDEQPKVAGLYLNRLKIGMKLDADPTVIFAMNKEAGFKQKIKRVYYKNLTIESPYNTYKNKGLPPGPICMPNYTALDAVLKPEQHRYLYFVADTARPGYHIYAETLKQQEENAVAYRKWLNNNNIR